MQKAMQQEIKLWINPDIDMKEIKNSMQIDSGTTIATMQTKDCYMSIEVVGKVKVFFNPNTNEEPTAGDCYRYPSEFPQELKDLISGNAAIYQRDGNTQETGCPWDCDDRVYVDNSNWFELFYGKTPDDPVPSSECVDIEGYTPGQLLDLFMEFKEFFYA